MTAVYLALAAYMLFCAMTESGKFGKTLYGLSTLLLLAAAVHDQLDGAA